MQINLNFALQFTSADCCCHNNNQIVYKYLLIKFLFLISQLFNSVQGFLSLITMIIVTKAFYLSI